jgi:cytochrome c oxidase subunit 1
MCGGMSGIMHSAAPADAQQQDSYFVVAHFHYVLIGGSMFALLAGVQYWFPKIFGRKVSEFYGKLSFWVIFIGFNLTFGPMHILGLNGMPRRIFTYDTNMGWDLWNLVASIGAGVLGIGIAIYFTVIIYTYFKGEKVGNDPWDGRTLEWSLTSPPQEHNFDVTPTVHARDAWWYEKHHMDEIEKEKSAHAKEEQSHGGIHMPDQSWWPLFTCVGLLIGGFGFANLHLPLTWLGGVITGFPVALFGLGIAVLGIYLWALEGPGGYHLHIDKDGKVTEERH